MDGYTHGYLEEVLGENFTKCLANYGNSTGDYLGRFVGYSKGLYWFSF